jgi:PAS domain S-box-containing protein
MTVQRRSRATPLTAELLRPRKRRRPNLTLVSGSPARDYEAELREREELHRLACEAGQAGSWYVRLDTQQCTLSPMAAALFGLPAREITLPAEIWRKRIDSDHMRGLEGAARSAAANDGHFEFEFRVNRAEGDEYWLYLRGSLLRDAAGRPVRVHGAIVDITGKMRDQQELKRLNETLEQRVAERGEELVRAQEALRQSQKLEAMGQLTGGIAHDFNNLLTPIIANLDLLQKRTDNLRDRRLIDLALKSADSAQILVQRLLAFARRQALQPARVEVAALVEGLADMIGRTLGPRIRIALQLSPDLAPVLADPNQLEMAILNLSVNARDAMPLGGTLAIKAENDIVASESEGLAPGAYVRLSIVDTGVGMDEQTCARAVEPFFSTKGVGKGTGLGLSMVDGLASQMGGAFRLSSAPDQGTTATLWLPVWTGRRAEAPTPVLRPARTGTTGIALVVDDHDLVRVSTAEMLGDLGYEVVQAGSGEQAAEMIGDGLRPDLVVTDHLMPGMSGVDLVRLVHARLPLIPVLLVSGYSDPAGIPRGIPCLTKPFRRAQLAEQIAQLSPAPQAA